MERIEHKTDEGYKAVLERNNEGKSSLKVFYPDGAKAMQEEYSAGMQELISRKIYRPTDMSGTLAEEHSRQGN